MIKKILKFFFFLSLILNFLMIVSLLIINYNYGNFLDNFKNVALEILVANNYNLLILGMMYFFFISFNIPVTTFITLLMGAIFGPLKTFFVLLIASPLGSTTALIYNRYFLKDLIAVEKIKKKTKLNLKLFNYKTILIFKIFPIVPFSWINVIASTFKEIKISRYFLINLIGCPFNIILFSNLGNSLVELNVSNILIIISSFILIFIMTFFLRKNYFKK